MQWNLHTPSATSAKELQAVLEKSRDLYMVNSDTKDLELRKTMQAQMDVAIAGACAIAGPSGQVRASISGSTSPTDEEVSSRMAVAVDILSAPALDLAPSPKSKK